MVVEKLTRLQVEQEQLTETVDGHTERHDAQDTWNKAFTLALGGLASGLAHAKAGELIELLQELLRVFRP